MIIIKLFQMYKYKIEDIKFFYSKPFFKQISLKIC